jgi:hypothetical protein
MRAPDRSRRTESSRSSAASVSSQAPGPAAVIETRSRFLPSSAASARAQLAATRQLAVRLQRGLLAFGPVDAADATGRQTELDDLFERLRLVVAELTFLHGCNEVGKPAAALFVLHHREHRLCLAEGDLCGFAPESDRGHVSEPDLRAHDRRGSRAARARSRRSRSRSGCRTPSVRSSPTTSDRRGRLRPA